MHSLTELNSASFGRDHCAILDVEAPLCWGALLADIAENKARLRAGQGGAWALFEKDSYQFTVALLTLLDLGCRVYLPGENHEAAVEALNAEGVSFIGDFPSVDCSQIALSCSPAEIVSLDLNLTGEIVVFTSGSTGFPKGIPKSLRQLDAELKMLESAFGGELLGCSVLGTVSHQHFYGLLFSVLWPLCAGRPFWRRPFIDPLILAAKVGEVGPCTWVMSPGHLHRLSPDMPWDSLRGIVKAVFSSGGPLNASAAQIVAEGLGAPPWEVFGSSETGGIACRQQFSGNEPWRPMAQVEIMLSDNGALMVRSPCLEDSNWYQSSDQAFLEEGGLFRLGSRVDRIVKLEGKRVSLPEVEVALEAHEWVLDAYTLVIERRRQVVAAVIVLSENGIAALLEGGQMQLYRRLRADISSRLPALAIPRLWRIQGALARNAQGKLVRARMEALFDSQRLPSVLAESHIEGGCELSLFVDGSSPYFKGHFDQAPVLPGVVQIMWAEQFARDHLSLCGEFSGMQKVKFKDIVVPNMVLTLKLSYNAQLNQLDFRYVSSRGEHSQGRLAYQVNL